MEKRSVKKWLISFFAILIGVVLTLAGIAYAVDPFFRFRVRDHKYFTSTWLSGPGLIRNYDYDTMIIGSSMVLNFDMDVVRDRMAVEPIRIGLSGCTNAEFGEMLQYAYKIGKADKYYVCIDLYKFNAAWEDDSRISEYLLKDDVLSDLRYLLNYDVWFRHLPVDLVLLLSDGLGIRLPEKFARSRSIDLMDNWSKDVIFGEKTVLRDYVPPTSDPSKVNAERIYQRMTSNIDRYLELFDFDEAPHVFFFPPYSALYWADLDARGYAEVYLKAKAYFLERAREAGVPVYDFQSADFTSDLDLYFDTRHYEPKINDWIIECFLSGEYLVTAENAGALQEKVRVNARRFRENRQDIFGGSTESEVNRE